MSNNFKKTGLILEKKLAVNKDDVMRYQMKHNTDWDTAKSAVEGEIKRIEKEKKKLERANKPKQKRKPSDKPKLMTKAKFDKMMKDTASDFMSDFGKDGEEFMGDISWDIAGSLMYDPDIDAYVRNVIAKNMGIKPEQVKRERVQEYIADSVHG